MSGGTIGGFDESLWFGDATPPSIRLLHRQKLGCPSLRWRPRLASTSTSAGEASVRSLVACQRIAGSESKSHSCTSMFLVLLGSIVQSPGPRALVALDRSRLQHRHVEFLHLQ